MQEVMNDPLDKANAPAEDYGKRYVELAPLSHVLFGHCLPQQTMRTD